MKPTPKIEEKRDQHLRNSLLEGETCNTLHKWTVLRWLKWPKPPLYIQESMGPQCNPNQPNNNNVMAQ